MSLAIEQLVDFASLVSLDHAAAELLVLSAALEFEGPLRAERTLLRLSHSGTLLASGRFEARFAVIATAAAAAAPKWRSRYSRRQVASSA